MTFSVGERPESGQDLINRSLGEGVSEGLQKSLANYQQQKKSRAALSGLKPLFKQAGLDFSPEEEEQFISSGIDPKIATSFAANLYKKKEASKKSRESLPRTFSSYSKDFGFDKSIGESERRKLLKNAEDLIEQGYDPLSAVTSVYDKYFSDLERNPTSSQENENEKGKFDITKALGGAVTEIPGIKEFLSARENPEGPSRGQSLLSAPLKGFLQTAGTINPFSPESIAHLISGKSKDNRFLNRILPTQEKTAENILESAGRVAPYTIGGGGGLGTAALEIGGAVAAGQIAKALGAGENVQQLAEAAGFSIPGLSKLAFSKLGSLFKAKGILPPKIKEISFQPKAGEALKPPSGPRSGEEILDNYTKIVNDSVKNLAERGITLEAINSGDSQAIKALQQEASHVTDLYKKADKINLKAFEKQRQDIIKKLPESPLEKYYAPEKSVVSTPETIAKNAEKIKPLETIIHQNERRVKDLQYQILSADEELRSGKLNPAVRERVEATRASNALAHTKAMDEIKNAKFEIKYGRSPATSEQIQAQIDKTFNELRAGIKDPSSKKVEAFRKGFERDKHLIDEANKLINRGEIPGPKIFDEYTKIHEQYLKNYDDLVKELKEFVAENRGKPRFGAKVKRAEELADLIKNTRKLGDAKLALQQDKRQVQNVLNKPSGAFYKNMLKDLRKDIGEFQKDYFTWSKIAEGTEAKTAEIGKKTIKSPPKVAEKEFKRETQAPKTPPKAQKKFGKTDINEGIKAGEKAARNPSKENIKAASEKSGMEENEYKNFRDKLADKFKEGFKKVKTGEASPKDEQSILKETLSKFKRLPKLIQVGAGGVIVGTTQALSEEYLGYKPPIVAIGTAAGALGPEGKGLVRGAGIGFVGNQVYKYLRDGFNDAATKQLKSKRGNPKEFDAYYKKLREKYGDTRANKIRKQAIQS